MNNQTLFNELAKNFSNLVIMTDLEPDDVLAIDMLLNEYPDKQYSFLVGEGNAHMKYLRANEYYNSGKYYPNKYNVYEGYASLKIFNYDGHEIGLYVNDEGTIMTKEGEYYYTKDLKLPVVNLDTLKELFEKNTIILCLKPPRELMDIYKSDNSFFKDRNTTFIAYTSFNLRCLLKTGATSDELSNLLNSFSNTYLYETYHAIGNDTVIENQDMDFKMFPQLFLNIMNLWNTDMIVDCEESVKSKIVNWNLSNEMVLDYLLSDAQYEDKKYVKRNYKVYKSIKDTNMEQFVNADTGLVVMLLEDHNKIMPFISKGNIKFNQIGYSSIELCNDGKINFIMSTNDDEKIECKNLQKIFINKFYRRKLE